MSFIAVVHIFFDTQFLKGQHAADAQQIFLFQTVFPVTAIQRVRDRAVELRIQFIVGIKQVERYAAYVDAPDCGMNLIVGEGDINDNLITLGIKYAFNRQTVKIFSVVVGYLLAVH